MSKAWVMDASAILAYLQHEPGHEQVETAFDSGQCLMTTVNLCEVLGKLCDAGIPVDEAGEAMADLGLTVVNFDAELAKMAAEMRATTKMIGASLGDRACLALARKIARDGQSVVVLTAEHAWGKLRWPFKIAAIR